MLADSASWKRHRVWIALTVFALGVALWPATARAQMWASGNLLLTSPARTAENHFGADSHFGYSLAVGDFDGDGRDDLAVGEPASWLGTLCSAS